MQPSRAYKLIMELVRAFPALVVDDGDDISGADLTEYLSRALQGDEELKTEALYSILTKKDEGENNV